MPYGPRLIQALMDCGSLTALLSWGQADGALWYTATASLGSPGSAVSCNTNETTCAMEGLQCGQSYNISVMTHGDSCNSSAVHMSGRLLTGKHISLLIWIL